MTKQAYQIILAVFISLLLVACEGQEANSPAEEVDDGGPRPTQRENTQDIEIDETFVSLSNDDGVDVLSLYTFSAPESESDVLESTEVLSSTDNLTLSLDTSGENGAKPDLTVLVRSDSIYVVDHESNELRFVRHFKNVICEVIAKELVETTLSGEGDSAVETFSVRHAESIYVVTATNDDTRASCANTYANRAYYELPVNFQFDAPLTETDASVGLTIVDEAQAKAKLVFGWVESANTNEHVLNYGYLGYSHALRRIEFFDQDRQSVWTQARELETYPAIIANGVTSPLYLFDVRALKDYQYLIQLNQDLFVVDASTEIFARSQSDSSSFLSDRTLKIGNYSPYLASTTQPGVYYADAYFDDDDLVVIDNGKIYQYSYQQNRFVPENTMSSYVVSVSNDISHQESLYSTKKTFSQFDYQACPDDDESCNLAHDVGGEDWQFITACDSALGCEQEVSSEDLCETQAELDVSQSGRELCSPEFYQHLDDLNQSENDAELVGFMQYLDGYINHYQADLYNDSLLISAAMREKDVVVQYFYKQPLTAPKSLREHILFGGDSGLHVLDQYIENDNLFVNGLMPSVKRSNECYKNYLRVECDLGLNEDGEVDVCSALDLESGKCFLGYQEFESVALFCSQEQLLNRSCVDAGIDSIGSQAMLKDESEEGVRLLDSSDTEIDNPSMYQLKGSKWMRVLDLSETESDGSSIFLLNASHEESLETQILDEGNLYMPALYKFNDSNGSPLGEMLGVLSDTVESVVGGVLYQNGDGTEPSFDGLFDVLISEVGLSSDEDSSSVELYSRFSKYALLRTLSDENSAVTVNKTSKLTEAEFSRLDTTPKFLNIVEE